MTTTTIERPATLCAAIAIATAAAHADKPALRTADGALAWTWGDDAEHVAAIEEPYA